MAYRKSKIVRAQKSFALLPTIGGWEDVRPACLSGRITERSPVTARRCGDAPLRPASFAKSEIDMFAPLVAKRQPKAAATSDYKSVLQRSTSLVDRGGNGDIELAHPHQRTIGNQAMLRFFRRNGPSVENEHGGPDAGLPLSTRPKINIGAVDDPLEQEADRVAEQVMHKPASGAPVAPPQIGRESTAFAKKEEKPQMRPAATADATTNEAPDIVHEVLQSPGQPLDASSRAYFEPRFGKDFSGVRVHSGGVAEQSAREVKAQAYTVGHQIVFGPGRFAPATHDGQQLLAHELTHVVQQSATNGIRRQRDTRNPGRAEPALSLARLAKGDSQLTASQPPAPAAAPTPRPDLPKLADQIHKAIEGLGTDEEAVYRALQR